MRKLVYWLLAVYTLSLFAACTTHSSQPTSDTLAGNSALPSSGIKEYYSEEQWENIKDTKYSGYVILRGTISTKRMIRNLAVQKYHPDSARNDQAIEFARRIPIAAISIGTRTAPQVDVCVVFYDTGENGQAIVYAEQLEGTAPTRNFGGKKHLLIVNY